MRFLLPFRVGHSLGLEYAELPISRAFPDIQLEVAGEKPDAQIKLKEGMVMEIHVTAEIVEGGLGACVGDMCLVTEDGVDVLTKFPQELHVFK